MGFCYHMVIAVVVETEVMVRFSGLNLKQFLFGKKVSCFKPKSENTIIFIISFFCF